MMERIDFLWDSCQKYGKKSSRFSEIPVSIVPGQKKFIFSLQDKFISKHFLSHFPGNLYKRLIIGKCIYRIFRIFYNDPGSCLFLNLPEFLFQKIFQAEIGCLMYCPDISIEYHMICDNIRIFAAMYCSCPQNIFPCFRMFLS